MKLTEAVLERRDHALKTLGINMLNGAIFRRWVAHMRQAQVYRPWTSEPLYPGGFVEDPTTFTLLGGSLMEQDVAAVTAVNAEFAKAKAQLESTYNTIKELDNVLVPALADYAKRLRDLRMTVVRETGEVLIALRDVRAFFVGTDHDKELARMQAFVAVAHEVQRLKADGTLDAIVDLALRLEVRE